jgi:hypothetical protein
MKNIQVIDGALNCTYDVFEITEDDFARIFPLEGQDVEFAEDFFARDQDAEKIYGSLWQDRLDKKTAQGIHGTLFVGLERKKKYYPSKRESEMIVD